ncbi:MAG: 30S ribosomal protein S17 [Thermoplasmata archaeon]|nr:MAG: 30S ribosomal protein S17 [Thermoplasmata archaeon]
MRDIGIDVKPPEKECDDEKCPWHGHLKVRGVIIRGKVVSTAMQRTVVVERERLHYVPKYERYEKRTSRYKAHLPPCIEVKKGDEVIIMECRPLSKTKHFVVVSKK